MWDVGDDMILLSCCGFVVQEYKKLRNIAWDGLLGAAASLDWSAI
jgi:hypothetical protein